MIAPVPENIVAKTLPFSRLQETRRNNLVCIHILDRQRYCRAFQKGEFIVSHFLSDCSIIIRCQVTPLRLLFQPAVPLARLQHRSPPQQQPPTDWTAWYRSEERRGGKEGGSTCRYRRSPEQT